MAYLTHIPCQAEAVWITACHITVTTRRKAAAFVTFVVGWTERVRGCRGWVTVTTRWEAFAVYTAVIVRAQLVRIEGVWVTVTSLG